MADALVRRVGRLTRAASIDCEMPSNRTVVTLYRYELLTDYKNCQEWRWSVRETMLMLMRRESLSATKINDTTPCFCPSDDTSPRWILSLSFFCLPVQSFSYWTRLEFLFKTWIFLRSGTLVAEMKRSFTTTPSSSTVGIVRTCGPIDPPSLFFSIIFHG